MKATHFEITVTRVFDNGYRDSYNLPRKVSRYCGVDGCRADLGVDDASWILGMTSNETVVICAHHMA